MALKSLVLRSNNNISLQKVSRLLNNPMRIAIVPHHNADGDAIGSALGLFHILSAMGHDCQVICPNDYPTFLKWMPGNDSVLIYTDQQKKARAFLRKAKLIFMVDFNSLGRVKEMEEELAALTVPKILIDHHPDPEPFANLIISDTSVSSTAELIWLTARAGKLRPFITVEAAECLFTGIMTDTGSFQFNCSGPRTWRTVASLLEMGIDKDLIHHRVFDNFSENRMNMLGYALSEKLTVLPKYHTGFISLNRDEMQRFNFQDGDTEGFVNYPLSVEGVLFSALFLERKDHVKISFRSKGNFPVNSFSASFFEGGGHLNAAGGRSNMSLEETILKFIDLLPDYHPQTL